MLYWISSIRSGSGTHAQCGHMVANDLTQKLFRDLWHFFAHFAEYNIQKQPEGYQSAHQKKKKKTNQSENEECETEGCQVVPAVTRSPASVAVSGQCSRVYVRSSRFGLKTIRGRMLNKGKEFQNKNAKVSLNSCWKPAQSALHENTGDSLTSSPAVALP